MKADVFKLFLLFLALSVVSFGQISKAIPKSAIILETQFVAPKRKLILWMMNPVKHQNETPESDIYTCPEVTRGSYYTGKVRVTLVNLKSNKIINTLEVKGDEDKSDEIDIPYAIRGGNYYKVPNPSKTKERKPQIMWLKDYNGDGKAQEFALFDALACMGLQTTLVGYSAKKDRVIQYPIELKSSDGFQNTFWLDYLFSQKPVKKGVWSYQSDYRGRGGTLDKIKMRYDRTKEKFFGSIDSQND